MRRNFSSPCMTMVGKLKISSHVEKFQMSPHERWNSPHMACVWFRKRRHKCKIYCNLCHLVAKSVIHGVLSQNFMCRKIEPKSIFVEKKWQISGLPEITWGGRGGGVIAEKEIVIQELYVSHLFNRWLSQYLPNAQNILKHSQLDLKSSYEVDTSPPPRVHVCTHSRCWCSALLHASTNSGKRKFEHLNLKFPQSPLCWKFLSQRPPAEELRRPRWES